MRSPRWRTAYVICAAAALLPFCASYRLPMADLPQHAAQIAIWKALDNPCYAFSATHELNWATPYLLPYLAARLLASITTVNSALKILIYLGVLALPLALRRLTDYAQLDPALALLGFPLGFGFAFYWGFFNFLVVVPLGLVLVLDALRFAEQEPSGSPVRMMLLSFCLLMSHALVFVASVGLGLVALMSRGWRSRRSWVAAMSIASSVPLLIAWAVYSRAHAERARGGISWQWSATRPLQLVAHLLSPGSDAQAMVMGVLLVAFIAVAGVKLTARRGRLALAGVALAGYLLGPHAAGGQIFLYERFAAMSFSVALLAFAPRPPLLRRELVQWIAVGISVVWMVVLAARFSQFHKDAEGFDRIVDALPTNRRVLLLNVLPGSDAVAGMPFLHFSGYYQERAGGRIGWSFSSNFPAVIRFRNGVSNPALPFATYDPRFFDPRQAADFDYIVVRSPVDMTSLIFGPAPAVRLETRSGLWWLYSRHESMKQQECPPLERVDQADRRPLLARL